MKYLKPVLITLMSLTLMSACNKDCDESYAGFESYRYELWKQLLDEDYQFDFVGTQIDNGTYDDYLGQAFDRNHEGIGGIQTEGVMANLPNVLANIQHPDIVLLGIGINDIAGAGDTPEQPLATIHQIIDTLQSNNPNVTIFIEQVPPGSTDFMTVDLQSRLASFNAQIPTLANQQSDSNSTVIVVDVFTDFTEDLFADAVHYNEQGAAFVASEYMRAIQSQFDNSNPLVILPLGDSRVQGGRP